MKTRGLSITVLALLGAPCAGLAAAQEVDRSRPPLIDTSTGGFAIHALTGPVAVDGKQWTAVNPILGGKTITAPNGQFSVSLAEPNRDGDIERYHVSFTGRGGKPVSLTPDVAAFAFVTGDSRWIVLEPLDVVDVTTWRRYQLAKEFGVTAYTSLRAISADGRHLAIERSDCAVDCPQSLHQYLELEFPAAVRERQPQASQYSVSYRDTQPGHRAQPSRKPCTLAANLATNQAYTVTSPLQTWSAIVQDTNAVVVPYDQAQACIQLRGPNGAVAGLTLGDFRTLHVEWLNETLLLLRLDIGHVAQAFELIDVENLKALYARTEFYTLEEPPRR